MYALMIKQFIRTRMAWISLTLILLTGTIAILIGKQFLTSQEDIISKVTKHQQEHIERNVAAHSEIGLLLYYLKFSLINKPDKLAALSIGQRDVNPGIQSVTIRTLEGQKYDTDLANPTNLQSGNLDLGFIIIYLFPLVIIAFTFNLLSEEHETGTWRLISVQSGSPMRYLLKKLSVRAAFLYITMGILFLFAVLILPLHINESLTAFMVLSVLYLAFWLALCFWIISFQRSSSFNALTLLSVWVVLAILLPAAVNNYIASQYPIPESLGSMVKQRDGYHEKWDMDKKVTMDRFYRHYPQFEKYGIPEETFSWLWYYAMQQMGDDESAEQSKAIQEKIIQREQASQSIARIIPTMHAQLFFNELARTSLGNHVQFLDSTTIFHEKLRLYFYPKIFDNEAVNSVDWSRFKPEYISDPYRLSWIKLILPLMSMTLAVLALSLVNVRKLRA